MEMLPDKKCLNKGKPAAVVLNPTSPLKSIRMKNKLLTLLCFVANFSLFSQITTNFQQPVSINTSGAAPLASAMLDVESTTKGLLVPRMTTAQRTAIASPAVGLLVFDTDKGDFYFRSPLGGGIWLPMGAPKGLADCDDDTWVRVDPTGADPDEIHMSLGYSPNGSPPPGVPGPTVLILRKNHALLPALQNNTMLELFDPSGGANTFVGEKAGGNNTFVPANILNPFDVGVENTALGYDALGDNTTGRNNTAIGATSLSLNVTGAFNTGTGFRSLTNNSIGNNNTATGYNALYYNTGGFANTAVGSEALYNNQANGRSTAIGYRAMLNADNRSTSAILTYNTAVGFEALRGSGTPASNTGVSNTAVGDQTLYSNTTGSSNTTSGKDALYNNLGGSNNTASGAAAMYYNTSGGFNTASGVEALYNNTSGVNNTALGAASLFSNTTRSNLVAVGDQALYNNGPGATGDQAKFNTALGSQALFTNTVGKDNTAVGYKALYSNLNNDNNTAIGVEALRYNSNAAANTATGVWALRLNQTGSYNTSNGAFSLQNNTIGHINTAMGLGAMTANTTGNNNTAIGGGALSSNVGGNENTAVGHDADVATPNLFNASAIGANAKVRSNNSMILGDNAVNVGIGLSNNPVGPQNKLEIDAAPLTNASGLRFRQLTSASNPITSPTYNNVLTVDAQGDVILVPCCSSGSGGGVVGVCTAVPVLTGDAGTNLGGNNFYFEGSATPNTKDNVGIGISCGFAVQAKLHVNSMQSNALGNNTGIYSFVSNASGTNNAIIGRSQPAMATLSVGVQGEATGGIDNYGIHGTATFPATGVNYGVCGVAQGAPVNYAGKFISTGAATATNYGVYASVNSTNATNWAGYFVGNVFSSTNSYSSDAKLKKGRAPIDDAMAIINRLNPQTYHFKTDEFAYLNLPEEKQYGLIAQEVESVLPEAVKDIHHPEQKDKDGKEMSPALDFKALNYNAFIPILIQGMKEQQAQIEALKLQNAQLGALAQETQSLQTQLDELRSEMQSFRAALGKQAIPNENNR